MDGPDVLGDVPGIDTMPDLEADKAKCARASTEAAGPSVDNAARAVWCGVSMGGSEMHAKSSLVDNDVFATVVDHSARQEEKGPWVLSPDWIAARFVLLYREWREAAASS
jgi:hypothetical protein